ncbi:MAG: hypothetical protein HGA44_23405, partial [Cellulomonadaceae bacterium]|nr:hypothetical protein [Cellulomonadaceae bacterium]
MTGWSLTGTADPIKLVPGSVTALRADATDLSTRAASLRGSSEQVVSGTKTPSWEGDAFTAWTVRRDQMAEALDALSQVFDTAASAVRAHADVLAWAQARAAVAAALWAQGVNAAKTCSAPVSALSSRGTLTATDPGLAGRTRAEAVLQEARDEVAASGAALATLLDQLSENLPDGRFHAGDFFAGIGSWFASIGSMLWRFHPVRIAVDPTGWWSDAGDQIDAVSGAYTLLTTDPLNAPAALLDTQTLADRPGRWWGALSPDIALTALGGVGVGVKALEAARASARWTEVSGAAGAGAVLEGAGGAEGLTATQARLAAALKTIESRWPSYTVLHEASGQKFAWNTDLYRPLPNTVYVVDEAKQIYVTDQLGRVAHAEAEWVPTSAEEVALRRHGGQQQAAGGSWRLSTDQGGHLVGAAGGGPGEGINLVAMD